MACGARLPASPCIIHKAEIPATYTLMAAGVWHYGDPMNIGIVRNARLLHLQQAVADCDVLITLGTRFSDRVALNPKTFARNATIIQIDIDPSELGRMWMWISCHCR